MQYNFGCLSIALAVMTADNGLVIPKDNTAGLVSDFPEPAWAHFALLGLVFVGAMIGMIGMGWVGDVLGRRAGMVLTLSLVVAGALASALLPWGPPEVLYSILCLSRFVGGVGVRHAGAAPGEGGSEQRRGFSCSRASCSIGRP